MINFIRLICAAVILTASVCSCSKEEDIKGVVWGSEHVYSFTTNPDIDNKIETLMVGSDGQNLTLSVKSLLVSGFPMPNLLYLTVDEWDESKGEWTNNPFDNSTDIKGDFFHVYTEVKEGHPQIKVELQANETTAERRIKIYAASEPIDHIIPYGNIQIVQAAGSTTSKAFSLKAYYKGEMYSTTAEFDANGDILFHDEEYKTLMNRIDANPSVQMVILEDSAIYYYDEEDIASNRMYDDIKALRIGEISNTYGMTRASGFEDISDEDLGFMAMYDNDNFGGKMHSKGLANYHFTYNIPSMKPLDLNDKITSIAVGYNGTDPIICTVLTIWEDTDFNFGDNDRTKHRISIIASHNNPRVTCPDLKKIKRIGSSKSWNDCISSFSLHFGYIDRLLLDY